jgi:hypothetical protein
LNVAAQVKISVPFEATQPPLPFLAWRNAKEGRVIDLDTLTNIKPEG